MTVVFRRLGVAGRTFLWSAASRTEITPDVTTITWEPCEGYVDSSDSGRLMPLETSGEIKLEEGRMAMVMDVRVKDFRGVKRVGEWILRRQMRRLVRYSREVEEDREKGGDDIEKEVTNVP